MYTYTEEAIHEHLSTLRAEADRGRRASTAHRAKQMRLRAAQALARSRRANAQAS